MGFPGFNHKSFFLFWTESIVHIGVAKKKEELHTTHTMWLQNVHGSYIRREERKIHAFSQQFQSDIPQPETISPRPVLPPPSIFKGHIVQASERGKEIQLRLQHWTTL